MSGTERFCEFFGNITMKNLIFKGALVALIALGLPNLAFACTASISLGEYVLGEWSNSDGTWKINDTVGDLNDRATTKLELRKHRKKYVKDCSKKGNKLIRKAERYFQSVKDNYPDEYDQSCTDEDDLCADPQIRSLAIQSFNNDIDQHVQTMKNWYTDRIASCKGKFKYNYKVLVEHLCK